MRPDKLFTDHPNSVGETYFQHMGVALWFSGSMLYGSVVAFIHALFPFLFVKTGSEVIKKLHHKMVMHRARVVEAEANPQKDVSEGPIHGRRRQAAE